MSLCEDEEVLPGPVKNSDEPPLRVESPQLSYVGGESGAETPQLEDEHGDAQVRVPDKQEEAVRERGDATGSDADALLKVIRASGILDDRKDTMSDEETGLSIKPSSRGRRIVVSDEGDGETPATDSQQKKKAIVDDNSQPSAPIAGATSNTKASALPSPDLAHTSGELLPFCCKGSCNTQGSCICRYRTVNQKGKARTSRTSRSCASVVSC